MIQFRWKKVTHWSKGAGAVQVDGVPCILQYKLHFVPTVDWELTPEGIIGLKAGRDEDIQWHDVTIDLTTTT